MNRARNADEVQRTHERFVYLIVEITIFFDSQTWQTHLFEKFMKCVPWSQRFSFAAKRRDKKEKEAARENLW